MKSKYNFYTNIIKDIYLLIYTNIKLQHHYRKKSDGLSKTSQQKKADISDTGIVNNQMVNGINGDNLEDSF